MSAKQQAVRVWALGSWTGARVGDEALQGPTWPPAAGVLDMGLNLSFAFFFCALGRMNPCEPPLPYL